MSKRPNIILCVCDQLRAFEVGCYGNPVIRTPNIDRLAAQGVRFENAISNSPVCMAARSALLSGQFPRTCNGVLSNITLGGVVMPEYPQAGRPHLQDPTLAHGLANAGYHAAAIGKWHIHSWPHDLGFHDYLIPRVYHANRHQLYTRNGGPEFACPEFNVDFEAGAVREYLAARRGTDQPFFLYYNISPPHCPLDDAPERYLRMFRPDDVPLRPNVPRGHDDSLPFDERMLKIYRWDYRHYLLDMPYTQKLPEGYDLRAMIAEYYGLVNWVDDAVGRMTAALDEMGFAEDTLVVFTSDHGDMLGSHGRWQKASLYEESIRIPLIVRGPGAAGAGGVSGHVASLVDLAPTLLELAGQEPPTHMQGQSFAKRLASPAAEPTGRTFIETSQNQIAVRTPQFLYGLNVDRHTHRILPAPPTFYDLQTDPYELTPLNAAGEHEAIARELDATLRAWHEQTPWKA